MSDRHAQLDPDALAHSERLRRVIHDHIADSGGAIPFSRFMELALYAPGLGYYSAGAAKFGAAGDFITAPELGTLFAECVAEALAPVLRQLGEDAVFVEIAAEVAPSPKPRSTADGLGCEPARYAILEPSADLRERQRERLQQKLTPLVFECVEWLEDADRAALQRRAIRHEVIDALPTPRFALPTAKCRGYVALDSAGDSSVATVPPMRWAAAVRHVERQRRDGPFPDGYRSELLPQLPYWVQAVIGGLQAGALLFVDYGYPRHEYYANECNDGTLRAFHRHHLVEDVFARVGLQDLTASVDFTALAEAHHAGSKSPATARGEF